MKKIIQIVLFSALLFPFILNAQWQHMTKLKVTSTGSPLSDFQVLVTLNDSLFDYSLADSSGNDIRFSMDSNFTSGNGLDYWIEEYIPGGNSKLWVETPVIQATGDTLLYLFYGNSAAMAVSDGDATFKLFDHFEGTSFNSTVWSEFGYGSISVQNSYVRFTQDMVNWDSGLLTDDIKNMSSYKIKSRFRLLDSNSNFNIQHSITNVEGTWHLRSGNNSEFDAENDRVYVGKINSSGTNKSDFSESFNFALSTWYKGESWFSGSKKYSILDTLNLMSDSNIYTNDYLGICVFSRDNAQPRLDVDWIFVRKFSDPEPQIEIVEDPGTGFSEINNLNQFRIYPNPSQGILYLEFNKTYNGEIQIFNSDGKMLMTKSIEGKSNFQLDLPSSLTDGVYLVKYTIGNSVISRKFILNRVQ